MNIFNKLLILGSLLTITAQANAVAIDFEDGTLGGDVGSAYSALGITFSNTSYVDTTATYAATAGSLGIAGRGGPWTYAFGSSHAIVASFDFAVASLSITGYDIGGGGARVEAYDMGGTLIDFDEAFGTGAGVGEVYTLSATSSAIYSIKMFQVTEGGTTASDGIFFDNLVYEAAAVPEPASMLLMGMGLLGMGFVRSRKK